jgi:glycosyltransferase involved in cell wall biosynthesis
MANLHVLGVPHTITRSDYSACAFTQKVLKFCAMMRGAGHRITHYGHPESVVDADEHVSVTDNSVLESCYGVYNWKKQFFKHDRNDLAHVHFNRVAGQEIAARKQPGDLILAFWGWGTKSACDANPDLMAIEPGIGYASSWARWRVYESYAVMHAAMGSESVQYSGNCNWYWTVIPNYFDVKDFTFQPVKQDYLLHLGRIGTNKGLHISIDVAKRAGMRLKIAGQGSPQDVGLSEWPDHVDYVGYAGPEERRELMANARALMLPSQYLEPFGGTQIEAFLSGTPVITSDWGVFNETNIHGKTGFRCRTMGEFVYAAKNVHLLSPETCKNWALENYSFEAIRPKYLHYFEQLAEIQSGAGWYADRCGDYFTRAYGQLSTP